MRSHALEPEGVLSRFEIDDSHFGLMVGAVDPVLGRVLFSGHVGIPEIEPRGQNLLHVRPEERRVDWELTGALTFKL